MPTFYIFPNGAPPGFLTSGDKFLDLIDEREAKTGLSADSFSGDCERAFFLRDFLGSSAPLPVKSLDRPYTILLAILPLYLRFLRVVYF